MSGAAQQREFCKGDPALGELVCRHRCGVCSLQNKTLNSEFILRIDGNDKQKEDMISLRNLKRNVAIFSNTSILDQNPKYISKDGFPNC